MENGQCVTGLICSKQPPLPPLPPELADFVRDAYGCMMHFSPVTHCLFLRMRSLRR